MPTLVTVARPSRLGDFDDSRLGQQHATLQGEQNRGRCPQQRAVPQLGMLVALPPIAASVQDSRVSASSLYWDWGSRRSSWDLGLP